MASILRIARVSQRSGLPPSSLYREITLGLFTPLFSLGPRKSGWLDSEVDTVIAARLAGKGDDYIRALVKWLVAQREKTAAAALAPFEQEYREAG